LQRILYKGRLIMLGLDTGELFKGVIPDESRTVLRLLHPRRISKK
jgi:hypothetical protein